MPIPPPTSAPRNNWSHHRERLRGLYDLHPRCVYRKLTISVSRASGSVEVFIRCISYTEKCKAACRGLRLVIGYLIPC
ncbi:hypothetical protein BDW74DRAFT_161855 [Aspergillus multicolor]|uniref:uncharacterized protein n=1 Tax=Aspergillus multicolor TaxID=41759 RepID=UPI003CCD18B1